MSNAEHFLNERSKLVESQKDRLVKLPTLEEAVIFSTNLMYGKSPTEAALAAGVDSEYAVNAGKKWMRMEAINPRGYGKAVSGSSFSETDILDGLWAAVDIARNNGQSKAMGDALKTLAELTSTGGMMSHMIVRDEGVGANTVLEGDMSEEDMYKLTRNMARLSSSDLRNIVVAGQSRLQEETVREDNSISDAEFTDIYNTSKKIEGKDE